MIVLNVTYNVKTGKRDDFFKKVTELGVPKGSRKEAGNIKYDYFFATDNENQILLIEHWKDQDAFDIHVGMDYFKELQKCKDEYVESTNIEKYLV